MATAGKAPEKSSFSQTCNLLSQYLKEKRGSFGDLSLGMMTCSNAEGNGNGSPEIMRPTTVTTMNLFPITDKPGDASNRNMGGIPQNLRSMDLFPQQAGLISPASKEDVQKRIDSSVCKSAASAAEPHAAQMTIFYGGQVIVFDNFPADKAKEIMLLAGNGTPQSQASFPSLPAMSRPTFSPNIVKTTVESTPSITPTSAANPNFSNNSIPERVQPPPHQPIANDLPIARRASLHRFLEKRKDRIIAKAPYPTSIHSVTPTSKAGESKPWLGLASQSPQ